MCEDNDQHRSGRTHAQRDESLLCQRICIFARERVVISQDRGSLAEGYAVLSKVVRSLLRIPVDVHIRTVWTIVVCVKLPTATGALGDGSGWRRAV